MNPPPWTYRPDLRRSEFADDADLAEILARALRASPAPRSGGRRSAEATGWTIAEDEVWVVVAPVGRARRDQGWKIHLSATVWSARTVLSRVLPILLERGCHFKFARSLRQLEILNGIGCPEGLSGKFLTVYPDDDVAAVELARRLDEATAGLAGPRILSDRPIRPGSLVHVRYGAFGARSVFTPYGVSQPVIAAPDGTLVEDRRLGRFAPPAWVADPFLAAAPQGDPAPAPAADRPDGLVFGDYRIEAALKRANRGGTYRARSLITGQAAVVKEARPHVATDRFGRDARDRLRHEHAILSRCWDRLGAGLAPRPLSLFERGGHLFLVREYLPGSSLRAFVRGRSGLPGPVLTDGELAAFARALAGMLDRFHDAGLIVRDLNPNNLILRRDAPVGDPCFTLIDLELAVDLTQGEPPFRGATLAYASPQQEDDLAPTLADDVYSLGATLVFLATAADPFFLPDGPLGRSRLDKVEERLALHRAPAWVVDLSLSCLSPDPADRPSASDVIAAVAPTSGSRRRGHRRAEPRLPSDSRLLDAVDGVVDYLAAAGADGQERRWPVTAFGYMTDPLNLGHGAAGIGLFLLQCLRAGRPGRAGEVLEWVVEGMEPASDAAKQRPIGLYYGRAGVAWFLAEAGAVLVRPELTRRAVALLRSLPERAPSPDVMNGTAGLLLAAVRLYRATGDPELLARIEAGCDALAATAEWSDLGPCWPIPPDYAVDLVGKTYPGYAYGLSGIAYALLGAAAVTGRAAPAELAGAALSRLLAWRQERDGRCWWPTSSHATAGSPCWLKGVAGIGAGLTRAALLTGDPVYREAAIDCWRMVRPAPRRGPLTQLNGLAGVGELCLDVADLLGVEEARADARDIARTIYLSRVDRRSDGFGIAFPDEDGLVGADFLTGVTGIASFLLRLACRLPRLVTLDGMTCPALGPEDRP